MAHVYEACVAKPEEGCLHWAIFTHAQTPSLLSAARILDEPLLVAKASEELMQHLREACARNQGNTSTAYNSWHDEAEKARILATMPPTKQDPVNGARPTCDIRVLTRAQTETEMAEWIGADCWSIFARKAQGLVPTRVFYRHDATTGATSGERTHHGLADYLDTHPGEDVCISLGCMPFIDVYYRRLADDSFVQVSVDCFVRE